MKKGLLLILGMLMMVSTAEATDRAKTNSKKGYHNRYNAKPIQFFEKGVKFYVYPNGEFDFNSRSRSRYSTQYVYRNGQRYKKRVPFHKVRVKRDYLGRIKRIGNTHINYNRFGKVAQVGSVFIDYRHRRMTKVGGLRISYDRFGNTHYFGQVKPRYNFYQRGNHFRTSVYSFNDSFFYNDGFYNDYDDYGEDDDYYYYKSKRAKKGFKKGQVIKRKKFKKYDDDDNDDDRYKERKRRKD